jgi:glycerate-2-kinase
MPRNVVAIGKAAGALLNGVFGIIDVESAFAAIPYGYPMPRVDGVEVRVGGHPLMDEGSFGAGQALLEFVDAHDDILFLISGGGSSCVEVPLPPHTSEEVARANEELIESGRPIAAINAQRTKLSAIKGGKLRDRVRGRCTTLVYSDVSTGALHDVASGPTIRSPAEARLIADNRTLTRAAADLCDGVHLDAQIEGDVAEAARFLAARARELEPGQILVAGGEPTVVVRGGGRGGRCSELAVRFAMECECEALFASSDGVDGNSGTAGFYLPGRRSLPPQAEIDTALARSDSRRIAAQVGEPIMITPTGNNLRDLFLVRGAPGPRLASKRHTDSPLKQ